MMDIQKGDTQSKEKPAFPFDSAVQTAIYPQESSWESLEDILTLEVEQSLRAYGIRNCSKREKHDALVQLGVENPQRLVEIIIEARIASQ